MTLVNKLRRSTPGVLSVFLSACVANGSFQVEEDEQSPEVAVSEASLLAGSDFEVNQALAQYSPIMCNADEQSAARQASILGRTIASSQALLDCIDMTMRDQLPGTIVGPYVPCKINGQDTDPLAGRPLSERIAHVQGLMRTAAPVRISCLQGTFWPELNRWFSPDGATQLNSFNGSESIGLSRWLLSDAHADALDPDLTYEERVESIADMAGTIWHESTHAYGYNDDSACAGQMLLGAASYIVGTCVQKVSEASSEICPRDMCAGKAARIPVVRDFEAWIDGDLPAETASCLCVRDPSTHSNISLASPATPVLGTSELKDLFGYSTAAGDFNGDGFVDLAVGAPGESSSAGKVYLYQGTLFGLYPWKSLIPVTRFPIAGDQYGYAMTSGDFNGDGLDDLAVGAPQSNMGPGHVYVFRGSAQTGLVAAAMLGQTPLFADENGDEFGRALAAGDFDDDGLDDLAVGAPGEVMGASTKSGFAFWFRGRSGQNNPLSLIAGMSQAGVETNSTGDRFGASMAAGKLHDSPIGDRLVIGASGDGGVGRVFVFGSAASRTSTSWSATASFRPSGLDANAQFGYAVTTGAYLWPIAQGVIAVGAPGHGTGSAIRSGSVFIYDRGGNLLQTIHRSDDNREFGGSLASGRIGSGNRDDLVVGETGGHDSNRTRIYGDGNSLTLIKSLSQEGMDTGEAEDLFGFSVAVGDFNGDSIDDIAAGAPTEAKGNLPRAGGVYTYRGTEDGSAKNLSALWQEN